LTWTAVRPGMPETKSVLLRGSGSYRVDISGPSSSKFKILQNNLEIGKNDRVKLKSGKDAHIMVKFISTPTSFTDTARVSFISDENQTMKSTIPLLALMGNPVVSLNGELKKKKVQFTAESDESRIKIKNVGNCPTFIYIITTKVKNPKIWKQKFYLCLRMLPGSRLFQIERS